MQTNAPVPQPEDVETLLRAGIAAAKSGQRERARDILTRVVKQDEEIVVAWLWLSSVVDSLDDREVCLENVLSLDPDNDAACKGLGLVHQQKADRLLREGIAAAKSGQRERAHDLLTRVVEQDEGNIMAWLWLSSVVDGLDDREVCLENVLALDPDNDAARRGLAMVRKQKEARIPPPVKVDTVSPTVPEPRPSLFSPAEVDTYSPAVPEPGPPPPSPSDEFDLDNEYLCPYCAAPTEPRDRKCKACGGNLWVKIWQREKRSTLLWILIVLQLLSTISPAVGFGASLTSVFSAPQLALDDPLILVQCAVSAFYFLYSLTLLIGLYQRWKIVIYLYLINAVLVLAFAVFGAIILSTTVSGFVCGGILVLFAVLSFLVTLRLEEDFSYERRRITLCVDSDVKSASGLLAHGHGYARRKMWALAALHMRRAVARMPGRMDGRASLILTYIRLKRYDLAARALAEARRINPDNPQIKELQTMLDDLRPAGDPPQHT